MRKIATKANFTFKFPKSKIFVGRLDFYRGVLGTYMGHFRPYSVYYGFFRSTAQGMISKKLAKIHPIHQTWHKMKKNDFCRKLLQSLRVLEYVTNISKNH